MASPGSVAFVSTHELVQIVEVFELGSSKTTVFRISMYFRGEVR